MADHQNNEPEDDDLVEWMPEMADYENDQPDGDDPVDWILEPADRNDQPEGQHPVNWIPEQADHQNDQPQGPQLINLVPEPVNQNYQPHGPQQINLMPEPPVPPHVRCPRCESDNTRFCYYNNYSLWQPRYRCDTCNRYWTHGGVLRDVPVGGSRRAKRAKTDPRSSVRNQLERQGVDPETAYNLSMCRVFSAAAFGPGNGI